MHFIGEPKIGDVLCRIERMTHEDLSAYNRRGCPSGWLNSAVPWPELQPCLSLQTTPLSLLSRELTEVRLVDCGPSLADSSRSVQTPTPTMDTSKIISFVAVGVVSVFGIVCAAESPSGVSQTGRFAVLGSFQEEAVLDRTTQLIWERSPSSGEVTWSTAQTRCGLKTVGGQIGWRLPSFIELMTIIEPPLYEKALLPALPEGHPFHGIKAGAYWASDAASLKPDQAYTVDLLIADVAVRPKAEPHPSGA